MSYYYKYQFVSPDALYANIEEELKSYFDTGSVDNLMFPVWTEKCLQKLGRGSYKIEPVALRICDFECKLPPDFMYVREAWLVTCDTPIVHQLPGAYYREVTTCLNTDYDVPDKNCYNECNPEIVNLTYKTTSQRSEIPLQLKYLLKPGNIQCRQKCDSGSPNLLSSAPDTFDIHGNKFVTNFREGMVYLIYYAEEQTESGYQMIPDNYRIKEFIEAFIKQKIFEQLCNQVTDETYNQMERKYEKYKQLADEAFIMANIEVKKQTVYDSNKAQIRERHSLDPYIVNMYGRPGRFGSFRRARRFLKG